MKHLHCTLYYSYIRVDLQLYMFEMAVVREYMSCTAVPVPRYLSTAASRALVLVAAAWLAGWLAGGASTARRSPQDRKRLLPQCSGPRHCTAGKEPGLSHRMDYRRRLAALRAHCQHPRARVVCVPNRLLCAGAVKSDATPRAMSELHKYLCDLNGYVVVKGVFR